LLGKDTRTDELNHNCSKFDESIYLRMSGKKETKFNVRVYGLFIRDGNVLLSDERLKGFEFTKFPGGGLEFGEGTADCIIREMKEETGMDFNIIAHYYTTDFFQVSAFHPNHQIISIYYLINGPDLPMDLLSESRFDFRKVSVDDQMFRWKPISDLMVDDLNFPIDRVVVEKLKKDFN
jgi:8-oxo-dGTP diphosphatase